MTGQLNLKKPIYARDFRPIEDNCSCNTCKNYTRAYLYGIVTHLPVGCHLLTEHNLTFQLRLMKSIRKSITEGRFPEFVREFMKGVYPDGKYPSWIIDSLRAVDIVL